MSMSGHGVRLMKERGGATILRATTLGWAIGSASLRWVLHVRDEWLTSRTPTRSRVRAPVGGQVQLDSWGKDEQGTSGPVTPCPSTGMEICPGASGRFARTSIRLAGAPSPLGQHRPFACPQVGAHSAYLLDT